MSIFANIFKISTTKKTTYPGDIEGDSLVATGEGSAEKSETAQVYGMHGFIGKPVAGTKGIRIRIGSIDIIIAAYNYGVSLPDSPGESKVYSTDVDGNEKATLKMKADGIAELNGDADNAVSFADLQAALNSFKTSIDMAIASGITGHTHSGVTTGPGVSGPGAGAATPVAIDISAAKVNEVKLP